MLNIEKL